MFPLKRKGYGKKNADRGAFHRTELNPNWTEERPQYKTRHTQPDRREREKGLGLTGTEDGFLNRTSTAQALRSTINGPPEPEKLLHSKGHCHSDKVAAYRMGKEFFFCLLHI